jgi:hypothetical protein
MIISLWGLFVKEGFVLFPNVIIIKHSFSYEFNNVLTLSLKANNFNMSFSNGCSSPGIIKECKGPPISTVVISLNVAAIIV